MAQQKTKKCTTCKGSGVIEDEQCTSCEGTGVVLFDEQYDEIHDLYIGDDDYFKEG